MTEAPFALPLSKDELRKALATGHGRALMHTAKFGIAEHMDTVLHACTHNLVYDRQLENGREKWIVRILDTAADAEDALVMLAPRLQAGPKEAVARDWRHYCSVLGLLAKQGAGWAHELLISTAEADTCQEDCLPYGADELMALEGENGLRRIVEITAKTRKDIRDINVTDLLEAYDTTNRKGDGLAILKTAAKTSPAAQRLLTEYGEELEAEEGDEDVNNPQEEQELPWWRAPRNVENHDKWKEAIEWVESLEGEIPGGGFRAPRRLYLWGGFATTAALSEIEKALVRADSDIKIAAYLQAFRRGKLPRVNTLVFEWTRHPSPSLRWQAMLALANAKHESVREFALSNLKAPGLENGILRLFKNNYQPGDFAPIEAALRRTENLALDSGGHVHHELIRSIAVGLEDTRELELSGVLLFAYEHSHCGTCRRAACRTLDRLGQLPDWVRDETAFDGCSDFAE